jgi:sigma-B regulation protein RsbU (phosphoserine phosphatase)
MPYPFHVRNNEVSQLPVAGIPLGLMDGTSYEQALVQIEKGDTLILASDGITDAANSGGEMYEEARFVESIGRHCTLDTAAFAKKLYQDVIEFKGSADLHDDITILAIRRLR